MFFSTLPRFLLCSNCFPSLGLLACCQYVVISCKSDIGVCGLQESANVMLSLHAPPEYMSPALRPHRCPQGGQCAIYGEWNWPVQVTIPTKEDWRKARAPDSPRDREIPEVIHPAAVAPGEHLFLLAGPDTVDVSELCIS
jgi:hypothetical protein